jgi:hypothetical protein
MRRIFSGIYRARAWGDYESSSGAGSTRDRASDFLDSLIALVRRLEAVTLLDAPCGDFNWAAPLADAVPAYVGVDVVPEIIAANRRRHGADRRRFLCRDIVDDALPRADVVFCRDALVHFTSGDVWDALARLRATGARYLIATTFVGDRTNVEIVTGDWRPLNLERPPFSFPPPIELVDERCLHTGGIYADKRLGLWRFADVPAGPPGDP